MNDEYNNESDSRKRYDYESRYPASARKSQKSEAIYLGIVLLLSFIMIILNHLNFFTYIFNYIGCHDLDLCKKAIYCALFGLAGGTVFDIKYFYRTIARGYWNEDRIFWRIFTPWISIVLALVIFAILHKTVVESNVLVSISIGFLSGYFSDDAIGKMSDVAKVIFSRPLIANFNKTSDEGE